MSKAIYWFRNDLRMDDNEGLSSAIKGHEVVYPLYILDERLLNQPFMGVKRLGVHRLRFILESLRDLKSSLQSLGSDLFFFIGDPSLVLKQQYDQWGCSALYAQQGVAIEETDQEKKIAEQLNVRWHWGSTLYHLDDLPMSIQELPKMYTEFRKEVENKAKVRELLAAPLRIKTQKQQETKIPTLEALGFETPEVDDRAVELFRGGETAGKKRLHYYLWDKELLSQYKNTRNGLIGGDYSSKFSPWLSQGCLSPRTIFYEIKRFEKYIKKNSSTYWLVFELIWRDYFQFVAHQIGASLFKKKGMADQAPPVFDRDRDFASWCDGLTADPFVNANMNELNRTGFMSNRGRQNAASYLIHDLGVDWRKGAAYFEKMLVDYDPGSNYGNWAYIAGVGNDPRGGRKFNLQSQKETYDPRGEYQALWSH